MGWIWSPIGGWIDDLSTWIGNNATIGGVRLRRANRALLPSACTTS